MRKTRNGRSLDARRPAPADDGGCRGGGGRRLGHKLVGLRAGSRPRHRVGALGCGIGQGLTAGNTTAGIARNPGAAGSMFTNFILGMVLIESIAIYALVVGLLLVFAIPP